jgi:mediator of replication checkpoint protein 1
MSPTRESSPAAHSPASSPGQLTPRSKVQALLASFDKDSDDESVSELARERVKAILSKPSPSKSNVSGRVSGATGNGACNLRSTAKDDTDDEEEEIVRPKGRLASRMQVNGDSSDEDAIKDGSLRIRAASESNAEDKSASGSDDNDSPVVSKKRKIRNGRKETPKSSPAKQAPSPGLFVSPAADKPTTDEGSDVDLPAVHNERFLALVQKQREKRLAREAEEEKQKVKKLAERKKQARDMDEDDDDLSDTAERRFTQPTRKASKKAQEEIRRETQRMSRNQQLAYNAVTKKKYAKSDFLAKFNFGVKKEVSAPIQPETSSSPALHSDFEMKDTPPTSPPSPPLNNEKLPSIPTLPTLAEAVGTEDQEEELPTLEDAVQMPSSPPSRLDKGKGRAIEEPVPETDLSKKRPGLTHRPVRVRVPKVMQRTVDLDCSDSDLEIVTTKTPSRQRQKLDSIFNRIPIKQSKESHSMHALRMLALVKSPPRKAIGKNKKPSITTGELQMSLQQRARQQAQREREERLQALRDKGIIIETPEEREKNQAEVEDIIAKARQEGEEIMMREKAAAKKERKANGEVDPLGESSDDEDWEEEKVADPELSASGSDADNQVSENDEEDDASGEEEDDEEMEDENATTSNPMFDNEADESDGDEEEADLTIPGEPTEWSDVDNEEDMEQPVKQIQRRGRKAIISDDEDSEADLEASNQSIPQTQSPAQPQWDSPGAPKSVLRSATKNFIPGITVAGAAGLGLTQIFAGTMDDSQTGEEDVSPTGGNSRVRQGGLDFLRQMPAPTLPDFIPTMEEDTQPQDSVMVTETEHIPNSQQFDSVPERIELDISQSQMHGFDSLVQDSQMSQLPDATQDVGFLHTTPIKGRFVEAPPSTVETVLLGQTAVPEATMETPIVKKKGKLRQRNRVAWFSDDEEVAEPQQPIETEEEFDLLTAFDVMRRASKKKKVLADEFDKKNSKAKDMVHEQADESEDEYAGLGGASDDESGGEMDELVKEMIDDEGGKNVDAGKLAAFFA